MAPAAWLPSLVLASQSQVFVGPWRASATPRLPVVLVVPAVGAGRGEFTEFVADHRLGDEHRDVLAAVVHGEGVAQEVGGDHRPTGPGLDDVVGAGIGR